MRLLIDGKVLPGHEISISGEMSVTGEDMSGGGAVTADADTGVKPQSITVVTKIRFADKNQLSFIYKLARAVDELGQRVIYTLVSDYTDAVDMRQAIFKGTVSARQDGTLHRWIVSFTMKEHQSVPEKVEQQAQAKTKPETDTDQQTSDGQEVSAPEASEQKQETEFSSFFYWVEDLISSETEENQDQNA